jgi:hypothetical protein
VHADLAPAGTAVDLVPASIASCRAIEATGLTVYAAGRSRHLLLAMRVRCGGSAAQRCGASPKVSPQRRSAADDGGSAADN